MVKERPASAGQIARARTRIADVVGAGQLVRGIAATAWSAITGKPSVNTTSPLSGGGSLASSLTLTTSMATARIIGRTTASTGVMEQLTVTSPLALGTGTLTTTMATARLAGRYSAGTGAIQEITIGSGLSLSGAGELTSTSTIADGDKGDITVSGSGATWTIDNDVVTYAKMQNVSADSRILGRAVGAGSGDVTELTGAQVSAIAAVGDASNPGVLKLGANGGALKYRDTAYAYVSRDSNGDASDLVASSATAPYAFQPVFAQLDSSGHPALLESWAPDPFFGGAYACLNAAAAATPSTSGVFVSAVTSGTVSNVTATYTDGHGWFRFATGTGATNTAGVDAGGIYVCQTSQHWKVRSTFRVSSIAAAYTIWFVVANAGPSAPPTHYMGLRWIQGTDTNLQIVSKDGTTASSTDSTVAFAANTTYEVVMSWDGTTFTVSINGTTVTKTTNMPATTENLGVYLRMFKASGATNYSLDIRDGVQIARLQ